jgi:hypothetical protein
MPNESRVRRGEFCDICGFIFLLFFKNVKHRLPCRALAKVAAVRGFTSMPTALLPNNPKLSITGELRPFLAQQ